MWRIKRFINRIKNLIKWFPVIWKDQDWDHYFIYDILRFKLKNQSEYILKSDLHVLSYYCSSRMDLCIKLIDRIKNGYYEHEYQNHQTTLYDVSYKANIESLNIEVENTFPEYFKKYKKVYNEIKHQHPDENRDSIIALRMSAYNHQRAIDLLFKVMSNNIEQWWD